MLQTMCTIPYYIGLKNMNLPTFGEWRIGKKEENILITHHEHHKPIVQSNEKDKDWVRTVHMLIQDNEMLAEWRENIISPIYQKRRRAGMRQLHYCCFVQLTKDPAESWRTGWSATGKKSLGSTMTVPEVGAQQQISPLLWSKYSRKSIDRNVLYCTTSDPKNQSTLPLLPQQEFRYETLRNTRCHNVLFWPIHRLVPEKFLHEVTSNNRLK